MDRRGLAFALIVLLAFAGCVTPALTSAGVDDAGAGGFSGTDVFPGRYSEKAPRVLEPGPFKDLLQEVTLVQSALDGVDIMIYVMRPENATSVPVIVDAGPYFEPLQGMDLSENTLLTDFVSHGYAFALVSVRGTGDSGGCMDLMGPAERHDIDQAITWLGTQPWSNGRVGMFGGSYDGSTQWEAASTGNPHLKTIVPIAAIPDLFSFAVRNGTWMMWTPASFASIYWALYGPVLYNPATGRSPENTAEQLVCPESMRAIALSTTSSLTGERDPTGFWEARDWRDDVIANYTGSIYLIHGFRDGTVEPHNAYPFVKALEEKGLVVKHTLGPWGHELPWRGDSLEILLHWYDRWLKDDATVDIGPRAQVLDNAGLWRSEPAWPPTDATPAVLHLTGAGELSAEAGDAFSKPVAPLVPVHDPVAFAQRFNAPYKVYEDPMMEICPACPTFSTAPLEEELRFVGAPRLALEVTPSGPGGHVTAVLRVVHEDGTQQLVSYGMMDLRFASGGETAQVVVPQTPLTLPMELQPTDAVVPAGAQLVLVLHQGGAALRMPSLPTYPVTVQAGALTLDTIVRGPEAFHEAPAKPGGESAPR